MAFLFKSKKNQPGTALPAATRSVHTSEGAPSTGTPSITNGSKTEGNAFSQTPTPSSSYNNSLNSATSPTSPDNVKMRQRADSESQVSLPVHPWPQTRFPLTFVFPGPTTAADSQWRISAESKHFPLSVVTAPTQFLYAASQSVPPIWRRNQCSRIEGRRYLHDGRFDRRVDRKGRLVDD